MIRTTTYGLVEIVQIHTEELDGGSTIATTFFLTGNYKFTDSYGEIYWSGIQPEYLEMKIRRKI